MEERYISRVDRQLPLSANGGGSVRKRDQDVLFSLPLLYFYLGLDATDYVDDFLEFRKMACWVLKKLNYLKEVFVRNVLFSFIWNFRVFFYNLALQHLSIDVVFYSTNLLLGNKICTKYMMNRTKHDFDWIFCNIYRFFFCIWCVFCITNNPNIPF